MLIVFTAFELVLFISNEISGIKPCFVSLLKNIMTFAIGFVFILLLKRSES